MDFPWLTTAAQENVDIEFQGTKITGLPKLYSLKVEEELRIIPILAAYKPIDPESPDADQKASIQLLKDFHLPFAHMALKRLDPAIDLDCVKSLPKPLVQKLAEYILSERSGWKASEPADPKPSPQTGGSMPESSASTSSSATGDSAPAGQPDSEAKTSAKPRSTLSAKRSQQTSA